MNIKQNTEPEQTFLIK